MKCRRKGCRRSGKYGFASEDNELYCSDHKAEGMVEIKPEKKETETKSKKKNTKSYRRG